MRRTALKPDSNGQYYRNLGWKRTRTGQRGQHKFLLGTNRKEAEARLLILERLWQSVEERQGKKAEWTEFTIKVGTAIARGETEIPYEQDKGPSTIPGVAWCYERNEEYVRSFNRAQASLPFVKLVPASPEAYQRGVEEMARRANLNLELLEEKAIPQRTILAELGRPISGSMFYDAMNEYIEWIKKEYYSVDEGHVSDSGMTKIRQVKTIIGQLPNVSLASLDYDGVDRLYGHFRKRPPAKRSKNPMKAKSCKHYIGELARFFRWLHLRPDHPWRRPEDYEFIRKRPDELEQDIEAEAAEVPTYTVEQLAILNEFATPMERVFFLLGMNCAFGADQSGRLKITDVRLSDEGRNVIRRVRRKKKVLGTHLLFKQTVEAMRWAMERRKQQQPALTPTSILLLNDEGRPYWRKTTGGNRCRDIANMWYRLLDRVRVDHPDFPRYGFNSLRDTSANLIRGIGGAEVASMHLTHKHQSRDRNLGNYTNPPLKRLFRAQRKLERKLQTVFDAAPNPPFAPQLRAYTPRSTVKQIHKLNGEGHSISEIARMVKVARTTVYRHLGREQANGQAGSTPPQTPIS